jgi:hypothetical protein
MARVRNRQSSTWHSVNTGLDAGKASTDTQKTAKKQKTPHNQKTIESQSSQHSSARRTTELQTGLEGYQGPEKTPGNKILGGESTAQTKVSSATTNPPKLSARDALFNHVQEK